MKVGFEPVPVTVPEKGVRQRVSQYPFGMLKDDGTGYQIFLEAEDELTLLELKKRVKNSAMSYEKKMGKTEGGEKIREIAVWIDEEEGCVVVACRADRTAEAIAEIVKANPPKKRSHKAKK